MTPQLQQAIRLLQLPTIELQAHIRAALESNVMLEQDEESDTATFRPLATTEMAGAPAPEKANGTAELIEDGGIAQTDRLTIDPRGSVHGNGPPAKRLLGAYNQD